MQPDIDELRNIRNSYYNSDAYQRNKRNNRYDSEGIRRNRGYYYDSSSSSNSDDYNNTRRRNFSNRPRKNNGLFNKISSIIKSIFNRDENVVYSIIALNIIVYLLWETAIYNQEEYYDDELLEFMNSHFTISWTNLIKRKRYWTVITSMFSHQDIIHLANNMFTFYSFALPVSFYYCCWYYKNIEKKIYKISITNLNNFILNIVKNYINIKKKKKKKKFFLFYK